jgi:hypothetical protein
MQSFQSYIYSGEDACSLDPEQKKESMEKYLGSSKPNDWD